jgi:hypothetical protein
MSLFARKDITALQAEVGSDQSLKRALGPVNLVALGIGAIIGAGIFVLTGQAAARAVQRRPASAPRIDFAVTWTAIVRKKNEGPANGPLERLPRLW